MAKNSSNFERKLDCAGRPLDLSCPQVMGILNVTPDSFFDGGLFMSKDMALKHAVTLAAEGAAIIDVGGESTRPGARPVSTQEEMDRVIPIIEAIHAELPTPISIDTSKPQVMLAAVAAGAGLINDVRALQEPGALEAAIEAQVPVCLMHMQGEPQTMQQSPTYQSVVTDVMQFLAARITVCTQAGIPSERIIIDPGLGFGKALAHNVALLSNLGDLLRLGHPLLIGVSRKSMIGALLNNKAEQRLYGSLALATLAVWQGVSLVRAHDVAATLDAIRISARIRDSDAGIN